MNQRHAKPPMQIAWGEVHGAPTPLMPKPFCSGSDGPFTNWDTEKCQDPIFSKWDTEESQYMRFPPAPDRGPAWSAGDPFVSTPMDSFIAPGDRDLVELALMPGTARDAIHHPSAIPRRKDPKPFHLTTEVDSHRHQQHTEEVEKEDRDIFGSMFPPLVRGAGDISWQHSSGQKDEDPGIDRSHFHGLLPESPGKKPRDVPGEMIGKNMARVFATGPQHRRRWGARGRGNKSLTPGGPLIVAWGASDCGPFAGADHPTSPSSQPSSSRDHRARWRGESNCQQTQHQVAMPLQNECSVTSPLPTDVGDPPHNVGESRVPSNRLLARFTMFSRS
mmetsp:Transcript_62149/g.201539  ORF Transcript_62149/g.201539 Transcript_62149/m.201539 type:complete len:332 (-) Transcript_62149:266-1261(-)